MKTTLSASEWKIMTLLWENDSMTIANITSALKEDTGWDKHTVIALLKRMEAKNAVAYDRVGNAKNYRSLIKREDVAVSETRAFLKRIYRGSVGMMISFMAEHNALSAEDIKELREIIDNAEKG